MNEFAGLRPEDFQKAWPNAYQAAVTQIATLQEFSGQQLTAATAQLMWARRAAQTSAIELRGATDAVVAEIEAAASNGTAVLSTAAAKLVDESRSLLEKNRAFQCEVAKQQNILAQARREIEEKKQTLMRDTLWRRLAWAIFPN